MFLFDTDGVYKCGDFDLEFSGMIPYVVSIIINVIKFIVPVLLVIFGMIDFLKSVTASKEDEIKKGRQTFINRLIAAVIVFFVVQIVQLVVKFAAGKNSDSIVGCFDCFIHADDVNCKHQTASVKAKSGGV